MLVLTFQKKQIANKIKNKEYHVDLNKSTFAFDSFRFTMGYKAILREIKKKGIDLLQDEGCLWGWVSNPSREIIEMYLSKGYVAMFIDVDMNKCVLSDYDVFTDYIMRDSDNKDFIIENSDGNKHCVQCSFTVDAIYDVRGIYELSSIIVYNSIIRSYYAMQALEGVRYNIFLGENSIFKTLVYKLKYLKGRYIYATRRVQRELRINYQYPVWLRQLQGVYSMFM